MLWNDVYQVFELDGSLRDILVRETSITDWEKLLSLSLQLGKISYRCDGEDAILSDCAAELLSNKEHAHCMMADLGGPVANTHFFSCEEIELDIDPREINSQASLDKVLNLCSKLSLVLERDVAITEENHPEEILLSHSFQRCSWQIGSQ